MRESQSYGHLRFELDNRSVDNDVDLASRWSDGSLGPFVWEDNAATVQRKNIDAIKSCAFTREA